MTYWYPTQRRLEELNRELATIQEIASQAVVARDYLPGLAKALARAYQLAGFPQRQLRQWIWVASQFRLHAGNEQIGPVALTALYFLEKILRSKQVTPEGIQDLNWVIDSTVERLAQKLGPVTFRTCLSLDELAQIQSRLTEFDTETFDVEAVKRAVISQLEGLAVLSKDINLFALGTKVESLFTSAVQDSDHQTIARAALLYLAETSDIVPDTDDFFGLIDDIYVIEWAYAVTRTHTSCLPLLDALTQKWPFVPSVALYGDQSATLDRFSQFISSQCLHGLFGSDIPSLLVLRDVGVHPIICAVFAAIQLLRNEADALILDISQWQTGQRICIEDGVTRFHAYFRGTCELQGKKAIWIGVRDNASITVRLDRLLPYVAKSNNERARVTKGNDLLQWVKAGHPDPLTHLTGARRQARGRGEAVLLLVSHKKLTMYLNHIKIVGSSIPSLFGVRYVTSANRSLDLEGSGREMPIIYCCSDVDIALDMMREPPGHVSKWHIVVDGAHAGNLVLSAVSSSGGLGPYSLCIFGELHEREHNVDIQKLGCSIAYLEDQDVEAPPFQYKKAHPSVDPISRFIGRQYNHWTTRKVYHDWRNDFIEDLAQCVNERSAKGENHAASDALDLQLAGFLRNLMSLPIAIGKRLEVLKNTAVGIKQHAGLLRSFDEMDDRVFRLFEKATQEAFPTVDREEALCAIASELAPNEEAVVVCKSERVAEESRVSSVGHPLLRRFRWMNLEQVRQAAPIDRIIVPGWLDRTSMRELYSNGYGNRIDFILLPFEREYLNSTISSGSRWERGIANETTKTFKRLADKFAENVTRAKIWVDQIDRRMSDFSSLNEHFGSEGDAPDYDQLESRALAALSKFVAESGGERALVPAKLVIFDDAGSCAYLPPTGKVIALPDRESEPQSELVKGEAERLLFRPVGSLEPGMVLAFSLSGDRDLVDARADQYLEVPGRSRASADLWRAALRRKVPRDWLSYVQFSRQLEKAGHPRAPATIAAWICHTYTLAPLNFRTMVPLVARLLNDGALLASLEECIGSIERIYRARATAAEAIVRDIFSGQINPDAEQLSFELNGKKIVYRLKRIQRIGEIRDVPIDMVGKVIAFDSGFTPRLELGQ